MSILVFPDGLFLVSRDLTGAQCNCGRQETITGTSNKRSPHRLLHLKSVADLPQSSGTLRSRFVSF